MLLQEKILVGGLKQLYTLNYSDDTKTKDTIFTIIAKTSDKCDFVICQGKTVYQLIQVSYDISSPKTLKREINGLLLASKKTGCTNLLLITNHDDYSITKENQNISVISAYSWLVNFQN